MQTQSQTVLEHGMSVKNYLVDLLDHLENGTTLKYEWKLPEWVFDKKLLSKISDRKTLENYAIYHDCGKPYCRTVDADGKAHFPNHAQVSYETYKSLFGDGDVAELIRRDMDVHLLKSEHLEEFSKSQYAATLLLTGLSEIHSNAAMFGGIDSVSFKIKWKHLDKRGRQILNFM